MIKVDILYFENGREKSGSIYWDGEGFKIVGDEHISKILNSPVYLAGDVKIYSHEDPEGFMNNLYRHFKGGYCRATEPQKVDQILEKADVQVKAHHRKTKSGQTWITAYHAHRQEAEWQAPRIKANELLGDFWDSLSETTQNDLQRSYDTDAQVWEGLTIGQHTKMVLRQFDTYFTQGRLFAPLIEAGGFVTMKESRANFRLFLTLHDIGKAMAVKNWGDRHRQHDFAKSSMLTLFNEVIPRKYGDRSAFFVKEVLAQAKIFGALVDQDIIGDYLHHPKVSPVFAAQKFIDIAEQEGIPVQELFDLAKIYFMCDAGAYTRNAGGKEAMDYLFTFHEKGIEEEKEGRKVFAYNQMEFSPAALGRMNALADEITKADSEVGDYAVAFHGTSGEYLKEIIYNGLKSQKYHNFGKGLYMSESRDVLPRSQSVFVTTNLADADYFATMASAHTHYLKESLENMSPVPVILKLKIPKEYFRRTAAPDFEWNPVSAFMLPEVKPEWIEAVATPGEGVEGLVEERVKKFPELKIGTTAQRMEKMYSKLFKTIWERIYKALEGFMVVYLPESMENWLKLKEQVDEARS